ncbi:MAG TPA: hypothetical protein VIL69_13895 [Roseomonas sp.]|jgi:hypothetical protein
MSRYFFHVHDGTSSIDWDGIELGSLQEAREEAVRLAGQMLRDGAARFWNGEKWRLDVASPADVPLFTLTFAAFDAPAADDGGLKEALLRQQGD